MSESVIVPEQRNYYRSFGWDKATYELKHHEVFSLESYRSLYQWYMDDKIDYNEFSRLRYNQNMERASHEAPESLWRVTMELRNSAPDSITANQTNGYAMSSLLKDIFPEMTIYLRRHRLRITVNMETMPNQYGHTQLFVFPEELRVSHLSSIGIKDALKGVITFMRFRELEIKLESQRVVNALVAAGEE